jgi:hypothetical protein
MVEILKLTSIFYPIFPNPFSISLEKKIVFYN